MKRSAPALHLRPRPEDSLSLSAGVAVDRACDWLYARQNPDGHWCGELEGDSILQSETILLYAFLKEEHSPLCKKLARRLRGQQMACGGWGQHPDGKIDVSASVKAYFALKLVGDGPSSPHMTAARDAILAAGGADAINSFTRFYLALLGQIDYEQCPAVPPEAMLLPNWLPVNIYRISAWSRTILVPLSIMWAHRPRRTLPRQLGIEELFLKPPETWPPLRSPGAGEPAGMFSWERLFRGVDSLLKACERRRLRPLRRRSLQLAEQWMLERFDDSDGLGAIYPPIVWSIVALRCLGYSDDSAEVQYCRQQLDGLVIEQEGQAWLQPCKSPVWDTALSLRALAAADRKVEDARTHQACQWLLSNETKIQGDWSQTASAQPGGWCFEYRNAYYPDVDDTIMAVMALREQFGVAAEYLPHPERGAVHAAKPVVLEGRAAGNLADARACASWLNQAFDACRRGLNWVLAMQNRDGGWGAFDKDNDAEFLCHVPFADHNAMIDPSTPDLTSRVLEALAGWGMQQGFAPVDRAVAYLRKTQEEDGCWCGRWGVNYLYGTWQSLVGLTAAGVPLHDPMIQHGAAWLLRHQQPSGGWGESPDSYEDASLRGQGPATPSQTAWALLGLMAAGHRKHRAVAQGAGFLLDRQNDDGSWDEPQFTGTGFPRVFYLRYHYYPIYFPLLALAKWRQG